ncbi:restriction endonuclease subunit S [Lactobacillus paragasseri]|nr:restriction endonuclease subunit S [Lactobacillus paragasseri]MDK7951822.1 restriction endonuclease subunit S [Lactobacillus paragasseri]
MKTNTLDFDAQALREKILDLAMRGKLVQQDPDDEPASVLLEKIKAEKEQLIKEKKIKKTKPLAPIADKEKPFEIPDSWEWVRLGEVIKPEVHKKPERDYLYLDIASVDNTINQVVNPQNIDISKNKVASRARQVLENNDILFSVVRPYLKNIAMVPNTKEYKIGSTGFYVIKPFSQIDRKFIFYLVLSKYVINGMTRKMKGDNSPSIRKGDLEQYLIPLPPLSEQSRIAAKIAQLFALLRKVESSTQQYAKLQTLLKSKVLDLAMRGKLVEQDLHDEPASVLLEKIKAEKEQLIKEKKIKKSKPLPPITDEEKPFDIPDSWEWVRLGEVITILRGGSPRPIKKYLTNDPNGINWIKIGDSEATSQYIEHAAEKIIPEGLNKTREVHKGDFLLSNSMSFGRPYILKIDGAVHDGWLILSNYEQLFNIDYLYYLLSSTFINQQFIALATGSTVKNLNRERVANTIAVIPPLEEQKRIVKKIKLLYKLM